MRKTYGRLKQVPYPYPHEHHSLPDGGWVTVDAGTSPEDAAHLVKLFTEVADFIRNMSPEQLAELKRKANQ